MANTGFQINLATFRSISLIFGGRGAWSGKVKSNLNTARVV